MLTCNKEASEKADPFWRAAEVGGSGEDRGHCPVRERRQEREGSLRCPAHCLVKTQGMLGWDPGEDWCWGILLLVFLEPVLRLGAPQLLPEVSLDF